MLGLSLAGPAVAHRGRSLVATPSLTGFYLNGSTNQKLKAAFTRVVGGTGRAKIVVKGDSTSVGAYGAGASAGNGGCNGSRPYRPAAVLASLYTSAGIPMLDNCWIGDPAFELPSNGTAVGPFYSAYDTRFASASLQKGGTTAFSGGAILYLDMSRSFGLQLPSVDSFVVTGYVAGNYGVDLNIDGSAPASGATTLSLTGSPPYLRSAIFKAATVGAHQGNAVAPSNSGANLRSIYGYNSAVPAWDIIVHANNGATAPQQFASNGQWQNLESLAFDAPDLTIINLGINDIGVGDVNAYTAALSTGIDTARISGDVLGIFPHPIITTGPNGTMQSAFRDAAKALYAAKGVAFLDLFEHYGAGSDASFSSRTADGYHPLGPLYAEIAGLEKQAIDLMRA